MLMAAHRSYSFEAEQLRYRDEMLAPTYLSRRWAAIIEDECVGFGEYFETPEMHAKNVFMLSIAVHPDYQTQGAGTSLYNHIVKDLQSRMPVLLRACCRSDQSGSTSFLERRGFVRGMSIVEQHLQLKATHINDLPIPESILEHGEVTIVIKTMLDLEKDPNRDRKIYELVTELRADIPAPQPITTVPFSEFVDGFIKAPSRQEDATFIALNMKTREYVGTSDLFIDGNSGLIAGLTGVRREYRRRGIALALKQHGIKYARDRGYNRITTFNATENAAIRAVNKRFGFVEVFTWLHYEKQVSDG